MNEIALLGQRSGVGGGGRLRARMGERIVAQSGAAQRRNSGGKRKDIGVRRSGAEEADSRIATIVRIIFVLRAPQLGAPLRYGPRPYLSAFALSLTLRRSGLHFLFFLSPRLRRVAAYLGLIVFRPASGAAGMFNV